MKLCQTSKYLKNFQSRLLDNLKNGKYDKKGITITNTFQKVLNESEWKEKNIGSD